MKPRALLLILMALVAVVSARGQSFNLSTNRSFAQDEQPQIHLYTKDVDALEFRLYRVNDAVKFVSGLPSLHSFGDEVQGPPEDIDERTTLERFHDWKYDLWEQIRSFFRNQFTHAARERLRSRQQKLERGSRVVSEAEFAQVPLLNRTQLVARWRLQVPSTFISDRNDLPVQKLPAGLYLLEATDGHKRAYTIVMVSNWALVTRAGPGLVTAFVVDRVSGKPVAGVTVTQGVGRNAPVTATTDATGITQFNIAKKSPGDNNDDEMYVVAQRGDDIALSSPSVWALQGRSIKDYVGYAFTDRPVYRPGHTVHWKAILRQRSGNSLMLPSLERAHVRITDEQDKALFEQDMPVSQGGDVVGDLALPATAALGYYSITLTPPGADLSDDNRWEVQIVSAGFHVEDYRKPEYRVLVTAAKKRVLQGETMPVTIDSRYFFGEPVANAKVKYRIYTERHYWWDDQDAGDDTPDADNSDQDVDAGDQQAEHTGKLDANGLLTIQVPTGVSGGPLHSDMDYTVEAGVTDAANREITGRGRFLATYGNYRMQLEMLDYALRPGSAARFRVTAVDYDNNPVSAHVRVQLQYRKFDDGRSQTVDGPATDVQTDAKGQATGSITIGPSPPSHSGTLLAAGDGVPGGSRGPVASAYLYILGAQESGWQSSEEEAQLVADKKSYAPGETAHLSLVSQVSGFTALVVVDGATQQKREVLHTDGKELDFDLPITDDSQPNVTVSAVFVRDNKIYQASRDLKVPPTQKKMQVDIHPSSDVLQPQQPVAYDLTARGADGKPVSADLSFGVVDEAIYSLYPDASGDMLRALYPRRFVNTSVDSSLDYYFSGAAGDKTPALAMRNVRYRPQMAQVKPGNEPKPRVRKDFPDTAYWQAIVHTDAQGHARVSFSFPDSLTTWRATVHGITAASQAGSAINRVLVRKNVLVRMGTPRFLVAGDELTLPVIAHNYLDSAKEATISLDVQGLTVVSGSTQKVSLPSKGEATVLWRLRAANIGTAKLTASAVTDAESDALQLSFPVEPAGVQKRIVQSGVISGGVTQASAKIDFPSGTDAAAHAIHVEASPTIAGSLIGALRYLSTYPYGCTEQTMSSFLPNVIVAETMKKLNVQGVVDQADLSVKTQAGLARLKDYQHDDGGWGWWKEDASRVYMTAYVVGGLGLGAESIHYSPEQQAMLDHGREYLQKQLADHPRMRPELRAAVLYALAVSGPGVSAGALDELWSRRSDLQPEALAMTGLAMLAAKDTRAAQAAELLKKEAVQEGQLTHWRGSYIPLLDIESDDSTEATAYAMRLLSRVNPNDPMLTNAAQWLMLQRDGGVWWNSTEQTAMVLFGLADYLAATHELDAESSAQVWVNGQQAAQKSFTAADAVNGATLVYDVPADRLKPDANTIQVMRSAGNGRLYWSASGTYYSTAKHDYQAGTVSLNLTRDYFVLTPTQKDGRIVYALKPFSGTAQIGDVLAVHDAISGTPARYLLLKDPIPAGTEFVTNTDSYEIPDKPGGWGTTWYTRQEFHDDHAAVFADSFSGNQQVFFLIRVVNPGTFQVSPASVQPMYQYGVRATSDPLRLSVPEPQQNGGTQ